MVWAPSPPKSQPRQSPLAYRPFYDMGEPAGYTTKKAAAGIDNLARGISGVRFLRYRLGRRRLRIRGKEEEDAQNSEYGPHCPGSPDPLAPELRKLKGRLCHYRGAA